MMVMRGRRRKEKRAEVGLLNIYTKQLEFHTYSASFLKREGAAEGKITGGMCRPVRREKRGRGNWGVHNNEKCVRISSPLPSRVHIHSIFFCSVVSFKKKK